MYHTAWTRKQPASSLPSDRIQPRQPQAVGKKAKGTATPPQEAPKSIAVRQLEALIAGLVSASSTQPTPDPKGGCFCQARAHPLSSHAPLCRTCGLVLCGANPPQHACPSCGTALLSETQRAALIARLETQLAETLAGEERARVQVAEEARRAAGAFPTLAGAPTPAHAAAPPQPQTRTVLSLNSKNKRVTVSSYTKTPAATPGSSAQSSRPQTPELDPPRVPPPPQSVVFVSGARVDKSRPYRDLSESFGAVYIPSMDFDDAGDEEDGADGGGGGDKAKKKRRSRKKGKSAQDGTAAGAPNAGPSTSATG